MLSMALFHLPNLRLATFHAQLVVGLGGEDKIGESELAVAVKNFHTALVDEDQHVADFSVGGR